MVGFMKSKKRAPSSWPVAAAKARLSEVIDQAIASGPQTITRSGRPAAVVVSVDEWRRKSRRTGNLAEFFAASPLRGSRLTVERSRATRRPLDL